MPTAAPIAVADLLAELGASGVDVRPATVTDAVDGVSPAVVASPLDTAQTAAVLRRAALQKLTVVARGAGTKLDWGVPPERVDLLLDTSRMDSVVEHAAGDLVVHVQAGVPLDRLQELLATSGQRLALDPVVNPGTGHTGTIGGTLATAADGPLRLSHGGARDLIIGVTMVRADGVVAHAGGKVVKNVAGYDLGKLLTGSWGTLGVITEAVFRLHPLPEAARWVTVTGPDAARRALRAVHTQAVPTAVELDRPSGGDLTAAVLVEGTAGGVAARVGTIVDAVGGEIADTAPAWWGRAPWAARGTALRLTTTLSGVPLLLDTLAGLPLPAAVRGAAGLGKVHAAFAPGAGAEEVAACVTALRDRRAQWGGDVVVLRAPAAVRAAIDPWGPVSGLALMRRIKHEFDPERRLAPGRFVGGI